LKQNGKRESDFVSFKYFKVITKKILPVLKVLTAISYCCIIESGDHIGGPIGIFLLLFLFSMEFTLTIAAITLGTVLFLFVYSSFRPNNKTDLYLFLIGGAILLAPFLWQLIKIHGNLNLNVTTFTVGLFAILWLATVLGIEKAKEEEN
jgi:hypothetical protein